MIKETTLNSNPLLVLNEKLMVLFDDDGVKIMDDYPTNVQDDEHDVEYVKWHIIKEFSYIEFVKLYNFTNKNSGIINKRFDQEKQSLQSIKGV